MVFEADNCVSVIRADGVVEERYHRWWQAGAWISIQWYAHAKERGKPATSRLAVKKGRLYFPWPPEPDEVREGSIRHKGYLYLESREGDKLNEKE